MQVVVDKLMTHYEVAGRGKLALLLHGWGDNAAGFGDLQTRLSSRFRVIALDLPGFGGTAPPATAWALGDYAQFIAHFLQKIDEKKPWLIIGHSNGGAIAIRGLASGQLNAERLVLLATAGIRGEYKGRVKALRLITKAGKALATPLPGPIKKRLRQKVYQTVGSDMLVAENLQETFKKVVTDDVRADAARLRLPTLLIYGENDQSTPLWYGERFHELIPTSTLEVLPGAEHFVHLERPQEVAKAIEEFAR